MTPLPFSVNQVCSLGWSFEEDVAFLAGEGLDTVSLYIPKVERVGVARAAALVREAGLRVALVNSTGNFALGEEGRWAEQAARAARDIELAARLGSPALILITGAAPGLPWEGQRDRFRRLIERVLPEAERHGVRLGLENITPLRPDLSFVHTLAEALDLVEAIGSPHLGVTLEINNAWVERGLYEDLRRRHRWLTIVQLNDFRFGTLCAHQRVPLGDGAIPLRRIVHTLADAGYGGCFDIEVVGAAVEEMGYAEAIRRSVAAYRGYWGSDE
jgi:sugar phosphate isomerase/epimerase